MYNFGGIICPAYLPLNLWIMAWGQHKTNVFIMRISKARPSQANVIAKLIMEAMNYDCCRYFLGEGNTLKDFEDMMTYLVGRTDTQYSYLNTIVALNDNDEVIGICVSYDGADLLRLRKPFEEEEMKRFGMDFSQMQPESSAGEMYFDTLCVDSRYRHQGIASSLIIASIGKALTLDFPAVGLLVDFGNPNAERLYTATGFKFADETEWGGHKMRHLQYRL